MADQTAVAQTAPTDLPDVDEPDRPGPALMTSDDADVVRAVRAAYPDWQTEAPTVAQVRSIAGGGQSRAIRLRTLVQTADLDGGQTVGAAPAAPRARPVRTAPVRRPLPQPVRIVEQTEPPALTTVEARQTVADFLDVPVADLPQTAPDRTEVVNEPLVADLPVEQTVASMPAVDQPDPVRPDRFEGLIQTVVLLAVAGMAGAASFTHMHDWTMANSPADTPGWFGWGNAVISELTPLAAGLEIRRRRRSGRPAGYPALILLAAAVLSLSAQVAQAKSGLSGWLLAAVPALGFLALIKLVMSRTPAVKES